MEIVVALIAFGGVVLGSLGTLLASRMATRASIAEAREARLESQNLKVRELAVEAYIEAAGAIEWLSTTYVEDSVDPRFSPELAPVTEHSVGRLRVAKEALMRVSAMTTDGEMAGLAIEIVASLDALDESWHSSQKSRKYLLSGKPGKLYDFHKRQFDESFARLHESRKALCGFEWELRRDEIAQGGMLPGSLLFRLRGETARLGTLGSSPRKSLES